MLGRIITLLAACALTAIPKIAAAFGGDVVPVLSPTELPGLAIIRLDRYEGKALYGYMDGGAELYREYGFARLAVQHCSFGGHSLTIELYEMNDSLAALGIFSVTRGQGIDLDGSGPFSRISRYAIQWAASTYAVRVINARGSDEAQRATMTVARALAQKLNGALPTLPSWTRSFGSCLREVKYVRGPLGLQNGFDGWSAAFEGIDRFEAYILPLDNGGGQPVIADIRFGNEADRTTVSERLTRQEDSRYVFWQRESTRLIVLGSQSGVDSLRSVLEACPGCPL